jgi:hypothetical protein
VIGDSEDVQFSGSEAVVEVAGRVTEVKGIITSSR